MDALDRGKIARRKYYLKNREAINKKSSEYYYKNLEKSTEYRKKYYQKNREKILKKSRDLYKKKKESDNSLNYKKPPPIKSYTVKARITSVKKGMPVDFGHEN